MDSLKPQSTFPIVRGLPDHTDSGTYYVRAVIKNARDNSIIETVNLVDRGNRYFSYNWEVPSDVSGEGFYISITTSVYTDSGYTTKSDGYGDEFQTYLVADRPNTAQILGGMGGGGISYKKVSEIVSRAVNEAINKLPEPIMPKDVDFSTLEDKIIKGFNEIVNKIGEITIPESEKLDYEKINKIMGDHAGLVSEKVGAINIPEFDYEILENKFEHLLETLSMAFTKMEKLYSELKLGNLSELSNFDKKFDTLGKIKGLLSELEDGKMIKEPKKEENKIIPWYRKTDKK